MKMAKTIGFLSILIIAAVLAQDAAATAAGTLLPNSTYAEENGWWGYRTVKTDGFDLMVRFAVYDICDSTFRPNPSNPPEFMWDGNLQFPATDRYIYAYQVLNYTGNEVGLFSVLNIDGNQVNTNLMHATHSQSNSGGYAPDSNYNEVQGVQGAWKFKYPGLPQSTRSWFLIFSSDHAPTIGSFKVEVPPEGEVPFPGDDEVPEPATIALMCVASGLFMARRNRKFRGA